MKTQDISAVSHNVAEIRLPHARVGNAHAWSLVPKSQNRAHTKNDDVTFPTLAESEVVRSFLGGSDVHSGCR
jgi:hypothetical protein